MMNSPCLLYAWQFLLPSTMIHFSILLCNCEISWSIAFIVREFHATDSSSSIPVTIVNAAQSEPPSGHVSKGQGQVLSSLEYYIRKFSPGVAEPILGCLVVPIRNGAVSSPPSNFFG